MADFRYGARSTDEEMRERITRSARESARVGLQSVPHSFACGGDDVPFESSIVIRHVDTTSVLSNDLWSEVKPGEFSVFAQVPEPEERVAVARSTFVLVKAPTRDSAKFGGLGSRTNLREEQRVLHFGEPVQLMCNPSLLVDERTDMLGAPAFLKAEGSMYGAAFELSRTRNRADPKTHFFVVPASCAGSHDPFSRDMIASKGKRVPANSEVCIKHVMSSLPLVVAQQGRLPARSNNALDGPSSTFKAPSEQRATPGKIMQAECCATPPGRLALASWRLEFSQSPSDAVDRRALPARITDPKTLLAKIKSVLCQRGGNLHGIREISREFRIMDVDKSGGLQRDEILQGLAKFGVNLDEEQGQLLFSSLDSNHDGSVSLNEFLVALRGPLKKRRLKLILMAYDRLDTDQNGVVTLDEVAKIYDTSCHPEVVEGTKSHEQVIQEFIAQWDNGGGETGAASGDVAGDGIITKHEFIHYYRDVSASIDDDDYFELMMRNAWHISGGQGWCENTSNIRVLVEHVSGAMQVVELKDDFGVSRHDMPAIRAHLRKQGITDIKRVSLSD